MSVRVHPAGAGTSAVGVPFRPVTGDDEDTRAQRRARLVSATRIAARRRARRRVVARAL
jgi:hypothetical protein